MQFLEINLYNYSYFPLYGSFHLLVYSVKTEHIGDKFSSLKLKIANSCTHSSVYQSIQFLEMNLDFQLFSLYVSEKCPYIKN